MSCCWRSALLPAWGCRGARGERFTVFWRDRVILHEAGTVTSWVVSSSFPSWNPSWFITLCPSRCCNEIKMFMLIYKNSNIDFPFCSRFDYYQASKAFLRSFLYFIATPFQTRSFFLIVFCAERSMWKGWGGMQVSSQRGPFTALRCWDALISPRRCSANSAFAKTGDEIINMRLRAKLFQIYYCCFWIFISSPIPGAFRGLPIFWRYLYSCLSVGYLRCARRKGWAGVGKIFRCLKYDQKQSQI